MPGDPLRAKWAAETFLKDTRCVNETRGMLGFTGTWNGHRVSIQGSGMGMPSLSIYANELIRDFGAKTLIRIGSCGGDARKRGHTRRDRGDDGQFSLNPPVARLFQGAEFRPPVPISDCCAARWRRPRPRGITSHVGGIYSADVFYDERPDLTEQMTRHGILAVEMEAAELYTVAARLGRGRWRF